MSTQDFFILTRGIGVLQMPASSSPYDGNGATLGASSMCPTAPNVSLFLTSGAIRTAKKCHRYKRPWREHRSDKKCQICLTIRNGRTPKHRCKNGFIKLDVPMCVIWWLKFDCVRANWATLRFLNAKIERIWGINHGKAIFRFTNKYWWFYRSSIGW